ncbi:MAG TPA: glycosyl hydrolase [Syntrophales bacterium]|nr:glycosyl hydrolase [Syntrophales bacterium]
MGSAFGLMAAAAGLGIIDGCAAREPLKRQILPIKGKADYKIYPPKEGCYVGFYKQQNWDRKVLGKGVSTTIDHYRDAFGVNPAIIAFWSFLSLGFPMEEARAIAENGIIPYISIMPGRERWRPSFKPDDVVNGSCDNYIKKLAADAAGFGERHGGFFFTTMVEPNADWWSWSRKPDTVHAVRHIWQIFEDMGTNRYATWVWEAFCTAQYEDYTDDPEIYFPGDKYVDWVGFNVFANLKNRNITETTMFRDLMSKTYEQLTINHPQKPCMVSEFGRTPGRNQPSWLADAFQSMKKNFPSIKAAIYYDNITGVLSGQDHTLGQTSLNTLKGIFKDPYWIMAKR